MVWGQLIFSQITGTELKPWVKIWADHSLRLAQRKITRWSHFKNDCEIQLIEISRSIRHLDTYILVTWVDLCKTIQLHFPQ